MYRTTFSRYEGPDCTCLGSGSRVRVAGGVQVYQPKGP